MNKKRYTPSQLESRGYKALVETHVYGMFAKGKIRLLMDRDKEGNYTYNSRARGGFIEPVRQNYSMLEKVLHWVETGRWIK